MMNVLFLCGIYPPDHKEEIFRNSKKGYQFAAQNFQQAIVEGFIQNDVAVSVVSDPFISTFPLGYKKPYINFGPSKINGKAPVAPSSFINIPFLKQLSNRTKQEVFNWCRSNVAEKELHILVYSLNAHLMKIAVQAKKKFENVRLSIIVLDLPEFMGSNKLYRLLGLKKKDTDFIYNNIGCFDHFVLLTEAMSDRLHIEKDKYCVVEGIFNFNKEYTERTDLLEEGTETILYTGALARKYGIETLLKAFSSIENQGYRLIICGDGEAKELVEEYSRRDPRIQYKGKVPHELIVSYQKQASLLINPRGPGGEYTQFSFPSKTMEYFASGTPVLMYRLPGVPAAYFDHCYTIDETNETALADKITEVLSKPHVERAGLGRSASGFIINEKNAEKQVRKIIDLIAG